MSIQQNRLFDLDPELLDYRLTHSSNGHGISFPRCHGGGDLVFLFGGSRLPMAPLLHVVPARSSARSSLQLCLCRGNYT
jgi:hypothetical protein